MLNIQFVVKGLNSEHPFCLKITSHDGFEKGRCFQLLSKVAHCISLTLCNDGCDCDLQISQDIWSFQFTIITQLLDATLCCTKHLAIDLLLLPIDVLGNSTVSFSKFFFYRATQNSTMMPRKGETCCRGH